MTFLFLGLPAPINGKQPEVSGLVHGWILSSNIIYVWEVQFNLDWEFCL